MREVYLVPSAGSGPSHESGTGAKPPLLRWREVVYISGKSPISWTCIPNCPPRFGNQAIALKFPVLRQLSGPTIRLQASLNTLKQPRRSLACI